MKSFEMSNSANAYSADQESAAPEVECAKSLDCKPEIKIQHATSRFRFSTPTYIAILSYCIGLSEIVRLALLYYQKSVMKLTPFEMQILAALFFTPEIFKPFIAYMMDRYLFAWIGRKSIVIFSALIKISLFSAMMHFNITFGWMLLIGVLKRTTHIMDSIICEYSLVMISKNKPQEEGTSSKSTSTFFILKIFGHIVGMVIGGWIMEKYSIQNNFYIGIIVSIFMIMVTLHYKESFEPEERKICSFKDEIVSVKNLIKKEHLIGFFIIALLFKMVPNIKSSTEYYIIEVIQFTPIDMSILEILVLVSELIAIVMYTQLLSKLSLKTIYIGVNSLSIVCGLLFLVVVFGYTSSWGIYSKIFCMAIITLGKFCLELNTWPAIDKWYQICPKDSGATSISMFTGMLVVSHNIGYYMGAALVFLFGIEKTKLDNIWIAIFVQNQYVLFVLVGLLVMLRINSSNQKSEETAIIGEEAA
jgi:hypothetical protein